MINQKKSVQGYWRMGPTRVPPLPAIIGFTDRADGSIWYLSHDATFLHITLNDDITAVNQVPAERFMDIIVYGAYDGPWLDIHHQLMVRSGHLGYDAHEISEQGVTFYGTPIPWTRRKVQRQHYQPFLAQGFADGDTLHYKDTL